MKREDLEKAGLTKEQIDAVMLLHQDDVTSWNAKITKAEGEATNKQAQIDALTEEVKKFDGVDVGALNKKIAELQESEKTMKRDYAIKEVLGKSGARSEKMLRSILDLDAVTMQEDGSLLGLDEQIKKAKENKEYSFLFEPKEKEVGLGGNHGDNQTSAEDAALDAAFGVNEN